MFPSRTAVLSGGASGNFNYLFFDGTDEYIQVAHDASINIASNLTVSAWVKTSANIQHTIISKGDSSSEDSWYVEVSSSGVVRAGIQQTGSDHRLENGTSDLRGTVWHNVVAVINKDASLVYVNGSLEDGSATNGGDEASSMTNTSPLYIGTRDHSAPTNDWTGSIDEVAIWNTNLDADAITAVYNYGNSFDLRGHRGNYDEYIDNLVAYWRFEEGGGNTVEDSTSNNNIGTFINVPTWKVY